MATGIESQLEQREKQLLIDSIEAQLSAREAELDKEHPGETFGFAVGEAVMNPFLSPFEGAGNLLAGTSAGLQSAASFASGGPFDFGTRFEEEQGKNPAAFLRSLPGTNIREVGAAARTLGGEFGQRPVDQPGVENTVPLLTERFGPAFDEELARINAEMQSGRDENPFAAGAGDFVGIGGAMALGRLPFSKGIKRAEQKLTSQLKNMDDGLRATAKEYLKSSPITSLARGLGRTTEAGLETAVIQLVQGEDPFELAGYVMGGQAAGSAVLGSIKTAGKHKVLTAAFVLAAGLQVASNLTPGGRDSFIASLEGGFEKVTWGLVLGGLVGAVGGGRLRGNKGTFERKNAAIADAVQSIPRTSLIAFAGDYFDATPDEQQTIDATLQQLGEDPEFFGPEISDKLNTAILEGNLLEALRQEF